jgi:hypothetical protein
MSVGPSPLDLQLRPTATSPFFNSDCLPVRPAPSSRQLTPGGSFHCKLVLQRRARVRLAHRSRHSLTSSPASISLRFSVSPFRHSPRSFWLPFCWGVTHSCDRLSLLLRQPRSWLSQTPIFEKAPAPSASDVNPTQPSHPGRAYVSTSSCDYSHLLHLAVGPSIAPRTFGRHSLDFARYPFILRRSILHFVRRVDRRRAAPELEPHA